MIFVTLGSQKFQFNRLLEMVDKLIEKKVIQESVFAQTGYSNYTPLNYEYKKFIDRSEYAMVMSDCDIVITHGGTGAIVGAAKEGKRVIGVPRLVRHGEHVDNHQKQIVSQFQDMNIICEANNIEELEKKLKTIRDLDFTEYQSNTEVIIESIERFILE